MRKRRCIAYQRAVAATSGTQNVGTAALIWTSARARVGGEIDYGFDTGRCLPAVASLTAVIHLPPDGGPWDASQLCQPPLERDIGVGGVKRGHRDPLRRGDQLGFLSERTGGGTRGQD